MGNLGWDTNNSAELEGLWQGLLLSQQLRLHPLDIEGDSQILINLSKQLLNGAHAQKIAHSWRLEARLKKIEDWLINNRALIFKYIRREGNKVADFLANMGVDNEHNLLTRTLEILQNDDRRQVCQMLVQRDAEVPDVGGYEGH